MSLAALSGFVQGYAGTKKAQQKRQDRKDLNARLDKLIDMGGLGAMPYGNRNGAPLDARAPESTGGAGPAPAGGVPVVPLGLKPSGYRDVIASIESAGSGNYEAVGPTDPTLGRALGRYQIMEANIGPWSEAALGRRVTADEFMASPEIQDAIFDHRFGGYVEKYGPQGAAQAWFAGPGGIGKLNRKDSLGTTVRDYTMKFNRALGAGPY